MKLLKNLKKYFIIKQKIIGKIKINLNINIINII